jgi:hypothetical protein
VSAARSNDIIICIINGRQGAEGLLKDGQSTPSALVCICLPRPGPIVAPLRPRSIVACGLTHMAVTPLDVVKCNIQIDPAKYKNIGTGFGMVIKEQGTLGLFKGWFPTLVGYSAQGAFKFGLYEYFKK